MNPTNFSLALGALIDLTSKIVAFQTELKAAADSGATDISTEALTAHADATQASIDALRATIDKM